MSKQDGVSPRTASDLERKYQFGRSFSEIFDIALDARTQAINAEKAVEEIKPELDLKVDEDKMISLINMAANEITITSDNFKLTATGVIDATAGKIGGWEIGENSISGVVRDGDIGADGIEWYLNMTTELSAPVNSSSHVLSVTAFKQKGLDGEATFSIMETAYISAEGEICSQEIYRNIDGEPLFVDNPRKAKLVNGHIAVVGSREEDKYELMYYNHPSFTATYVIYIDPADNVVKATMAYG